MPFDAYKQYLSLKDLTTNTVVRVVQLFNLSIRGKTVSGLRNLHVTSLTKEVIEFFVSNFITCTDPSKLWIGEMIREGEGRYVSWKKRTQSLSYIFKEETEKLFADGDFDSMFALDGSRHPQILKEYLRDNISLETMVILNNILGYKDQWDKVLTDPVWQTVSLRIRKYTPFLNIDVFRYKKILKKVVLGET